LVSGDFAKYAFFGLLVLALIFEVGGDVFFKKWSLGGKNYVLLFGLLLYFIGTVFWAISLKYEYLSKAITVFTVMNLIAVVAIGVLYFKEDISLVNKIGIGLGVVSVFLMEL